MRQGFSVFTHGLNDGCFDTVFFFDMLGKRNCRLLAVGIVDPNITAFCCELFPNQRTQSSVEAVNKTRVSSVGNRNSGPKETLTEFIE